MNPVKILIEEHITLEKMISFLTFLYLNPEKIKAHLFNQMIDFFSTYVDKCHHWKEERILFHRLKNKKLSKEDENLMNELIEEHRLGRQLAQELNGYKTAENIEKIKEIFLAITTLYTLHMEKENKKFFFPAFNYFSDSEKEKILQEFIEIDKELIHLKYLQVVEELESLVKK